MWLELRTVFDHLSHDSSTRTILLSGAGPKGFTAGIDIRSQSTPLTRESQNAASSSTPPDGARAATRIRRHVNEFQACISSIEKCEKPVVAIMHGFCFGLGIDIACCADLRICAVDTKFSVKEVDVGIAADIGTLTRLPKIVGNGSWVKDVCLSARVFGAEEAAKVGFVSWVGGGKEDAIRQGLGWGKTVAEKSPVAVQSTKELLNWSKDRTVQDGEFPRLTAWERAVRLLWELTDAQVYVIRVSGTVLRYKHLISRRQ